MKASLFTLICLINGFCIGQKTPQTLLKKSEEGTASYHINLAERAYQSANSVKLKFNALDRIAIIHFQNDRREEFLSSSQRGMRFSRRRKYQWGIARSHYNIGSYYRTVNKFDSAYYHHFQAAKIFQSIEDSLESAKNLLNLSIMSLNVGDYEQCEEESVQALKLLPTNAPDWMNTSLFNNLGVSFVERKDYDASIYWYKKSLQYATTPKERITLLNNIGVVYRKWKDYSSSIKHFSSALRVKGCDSIPQYRAMVLDNLGYSIFLREGGGLTYMIEGYGLRTEGANEYGQIVNEIHLAEYHYHKGQLENAKDYLISALQKARKLKSTKYQLRSLELLTQYFIDPDSFRRYIVLRDSLDQVDRIARSKHASIRFETEQKERENLELEKQNLSKEVRLQRERKQKIYLWTGIAILMATVILIIFFFRARRRKAEYKSRVKTLKAKLDQQNTISRRLHSDIANDLLQGIRESDRLNGELNNQEFAKIIDRFEEVYDRTVRISQDIGTYQFEKHGFVSSIKFLVHSFENTSGLHISVDGIDVIAWDKNALEIQYELYLMIKELISNVHKHTNARTINLRFLLQEGNIVASVQDDGEGIQGNHSSGIGIVSIRKKAEELGGDFKLKTSKKGVVAVITIPVSKT